MAIYITITGRMLGTCTKKLRLTVVECDELAGRMRNAKCEMRKGKRRLESREWNAAPSMTGERVKVKIVFVLRLGRPPPTRRFVFRHLAVWPRLAFLSLFFSFFFSLTLFSAARLILASSLPRCYSYN